MNESTKPLHQQADQYLDANNLTAAYSIYEKICQLDPQDAEAFMMMGVLDGETGKINDAITNLEHALLIDSVYADAHNALAQIYKHQSKFELALTHARQAVDSDPEFFEAVNLLAGLCGQLGHFQEAESNAEKALILNPSHIETHLLLANALMEQEKYKEAIDEFQKIISKSPGNAHIYSRMGTAMARLGNNNDAIPMLEKAINLNPGSLENRRILAHVYAAAKNFSLAAEQWQLILTDNADDEEGWAVLTSLHEKLNNWESYLRFLDEQIKKTPNNRHALINQAFSQEKTGQTEKAITTYLQLTELYPDWKESWNRLGLLYAQQNNFMNAHKCLDKVIKLGTEAPVSYVMYARSLSYYGKHEDAELACKQAIELAPDYLQAYLYLSSAQLTQGKLDDAINTLKHALTRHPDDLSLIAGIAEIHERRSELEKAEKILQPHLSTDRSSPVIVNIFAKISLKLNRGEQALSLINAALENTLPVDIEKQLLFNLANIYDSMHDYKAAMQTYHKANSLCKKSFDRNKHSSFIRSITNLFNQEMLSKFKNMGNPSVQPIFILGMIRSGSSLVEQMLSSHSEVYGGGELMYLSHAADNIGLTPDSENMENALITLDSMTVINEAKQYLDNISLKTTNGEKHVTDKMPANFLYLGLIQILFPNAKIIHTRRQPLDTCLSCYCIDFKGTHEYTSDLTDLGHYYYEYERLMSHWHKVLDLDILDVAYEDLVSDTETVARRIVEHCGLDWQNAILDYHLSNRVINTASYNQANKPVYQSSVNRWQAYEDWLSPLKKSLEANI